MFYQPEVTQLTRIGSDGRDHKEVTQLTRTSVHRLQRRNSLPQKDIDQKDTGTKEPA